MKIWHEDFSQEDLDVELTQTPDPAIPLTLGRPLKGVLPVALKVTLRYRRRRPDAFVAGPIIVVDDKVKQELQSARTEIAFLVVEGKDARTKERLPYYFAPVLADSGLVEALRQRVAARPVTVPAVRPR